MKQAQFNELYLQTLKNGDFNGFRQLTAQYPQRANKAPRFAEVSELLASDAVEAEKFAQIAAFLRQNAVSKVRGACLCVAFLIALALFLLPALGEQTDSSFYAVNGALLGLYVLLGAVAKNALKFSAYAGFALALAVLAGNIVLAGNAAGIVPVILMLSAIKTLPK
ncbi:MAG: hypothetical protein IJE97_04790 [Thermoguttaceae bacterium]|nr:hypothetical protein [Thermoguttaceae bacterium]MBQ6826631.1 hypothetical protein [Thermoguttaceae bacterium]